MNLKKEKLVSLKVESLKIIFEFTEVKYVGALITKVKTH